jgi:hypothetical protein
MKSAEDYLFFDDWIVTEDCIGCKYLIEEYKNGLIENTYAGNFIDESLEKCFVECGFIDGVHDLTETNCHFISILEALAYGLVE